MRKKVIVGLGIITFILIGVVILNQNTTLAEDAVQVSENIVRIQDGSIVEGDEIWEKFKTNSLSGNSDEIKIISELEGEVYKYTLKYDGDKYSYFDEEGTVSVRMKYLLDVSGEMPISDNENRKSRLVVLANQEYTFGELFTSTVSSNSADSIDFEIIFWE